MNEKIDMTFIKNIDKYVDFLHKLSEVKFSDWQHEILYDRDVTNCQRLILSAPTGSGKTIVSYVFANLHRLHEDLSKEYDRIIFTANVKTLSVERYNDLKNIGLNVGINIGDKKKNIEAPVICCTQETYNLKYKKYKDERHIVIMDEFHEMYDSPDRVKNYVLSLYKVKKDDKILILSATLGNINDFKEYIEYVTELPFELYETNERLTKLVFLDKPVNIEDIITHNSLLISFSIKNINTICEKLKEYISSNIKSRSLLDEEQSKILDSALKEFTEKYPSIYIQQDIFTYLRMGFSPFYANLPYQIKDLIYDLYKEGILRILISTDSIKTGVNLPIEYVIFTQLTSMHFVNSNGLNNKPYMSIKKFLQIAGRAGRKGYYDTGYVGICREFGNFEMYKERRVKYDISEVYDYLLNEKDINFQIIIKPDYLDLLLTINDKYEDKDFVNKLINEEVEFIIKYSTISYNKDSLQEEISLKLEDIYDTIKSNIKKKYIKYFFGLLEYTKEKYLSIDTIIKVYSKIFNNKEIDVMHDYDIDENNKTQDIKHLFNVYKSYLTLRNLYIEIDKKTKIEVKFHKYFLERFLELKNKYGIDDRMY
jgi:replicative superfamily II helicase